MNLIKKIVSYSLALSVAFSGICATATEPEMGGKNLAVSHQTPKKES